MKRTLIASAAAAAFLAAPAWAARDAHEQHHAADGAKQSRQMQVAAPATGGQGMGPGMMGQGMGPGMVGGTMGPGMMGGQGMGPSMMSGAGPYAALDLSSEQRSKIAEIQQELWRKQWDLMGKMHEERFHMHQLYSGAETDDGAVRKAYRAMADSHKQMFEAMLDTRKRVDAVFTKEQREKLNGGGRGG